MLKRPECFASISWTSNQTVVILNCLSRDAEHSENQVYWLLLAIRPLRDNDHVDFCLGPERTEMLKDLCKMIENGHLRTPDSEHFGLEDYKNALQNSLSSYSKKSLFFL